jgi:hypothetical protein
MEQKILSVLTKWAHNNLKIPITASYQNLKLSLKIK